MSNGVDNVVVNYFEQIFKSEQWDFAEVIGAIIPRVTEGHTELLCAPFTVKEIRAVVFDMHPSKSPKGRRY